MTISYHSGNRIQGLSTDFNNGIIPAVSGGWKELGRTTLGSANSNITVSSLADKRYLMVLTSITGSTGAQNVFHRFNGDSGSNYSGRISNNGEADGTETSNTQSFVGGGGQYADSNPDFIVSYIANYTSKEKLGITHSVTQNTAGAGYAPKRDETVFKWANTSSAISSITDTTINANTYNSGSEMVVLGWDPSDTHTNNFWQELVGSASGDLNSDTSTYGTHSTGTFTAKKYIWAQWYGSTNTGGGTNPRIQVGNTTIDTGNNYAVRYSHNGASDGTQTSRGDVPYNTDTGHTALFCNVFLINNSSNEKLGIVHWIRQNTAGAGNAPNRQETVFKWVNTSNQINIMGMNVQDGAKISAGAKWRVWGSD